MASSRVLCAEIYHYTRQGSRVQKNTCQSGSKPFRQVRYLSGLEIHTGKAQQECRIIRLRGGQLTALNGLKKSKSARYAMHFTVTDRTGNPTLETVAGGGLFSQEIYYPFGGTAVYRQRACGYDKRVRYAGKERDITGLYYYGFRYYVPWLMRWLNPDPAGTIDGLNKLRMVRNNPLTWKDEDGRTTTEENLQMQPLHQPGETRETRSNNRAISFKTLCKGGLALIAFAALGGLAYLLSGAAAVAGVNHSRFAPTGLLNNSSMDNFPYLTENQTENALNNTNKTDSSFSKNPAGGFEALSYINWEVVNMEAEAGADGPRLHMSHSILNYQRFQVPKIKRWDGYITFLEEFVGNQDVAPQMRNVYKTIELHLEGLEEIRVELAYHEEKKGSDLLPMWKDWKFINTQLKKEQKTLRIFDNRLREVGGYGPRNLNAPPYYGLYNAR